MIANNKGLGRGLDAILSDFKEEDILKEEQQKKNRLMLCLVQPH